MLRSTSARQRSSRRPLLTSRGSDISTQSAGFPEVDTDTFLDWNSSFTTPDSSTHLRSTGVYATSTQATHATGNQLQHADSLTPLSTHAHLQQPSTASSASSALSVSAAAHSSSINGVRQGVNSVLNPQAAHAAIESVSIPPMGLQIPKLAPLDVPPDMPSGVSIATARVKHPLSSTESAALTQLRSELKSLLAKANDPPDLSLGPLPKPPPHPLPPPTVLATKVARPKPLLRHSSSLVRKNTRRRATADAAVPIRSARVKPAPAALQPLQPCAKATKAAKQKGQLSSRAVVNCPRAVPSSHITEASPSSCRAVAQGPDALVSSPGAVAEQAKAAHPDQHASSLDTAPGYELAAYADNAASAACDTAQYANQTYTQATEDARDHQLSVEMAKSSKPKQLSKCASWPAASSVLREGITHDSVASTSYSSRNGETTSSQITFSCEFEGGNVECVRPAENGLDYDVHVRQDSNAPKHRLWFHFQMQGGSAGQRVVLNFVNFSKARALYRYGMTPLVRSGTHPQWARLPPSSCFYYKSLRHRTSNVLSVLFTIDRPKEVYEFAYTYPYNYSELQQWLLGLERQAAPYLQRRLLCRTPQMKRVDMLTVEETSSQVGSPRQRPVLFVTARVHPGETPASFVIHGLVEWLLSPLAAAQKLRQAATVVVVPMLNPDGVFLGNYRTDAGGLDLNRQWGCPSPHTEPALFHVMQQLHRYASDPTYSLELFLDIHGHSASRSGFLFCNPPEDQSILASERVNRLTELLEGSMPGFSKAATRYDEDARKAGCARRVVGACFKDILSYTLEISMFNGTPIPGKNPSPQGKGGSGAGGVSARDNSVPEPDVDFSNTPEGYFEMGKQLGVAFSTMYGSHK